MIIMGLVVSPYFGAAVSVAATIIVNEGSAEKDCFYFKQKIYYHESLRSFDKKVRTYFYSDSRYTNETRDARTTHYEIYVGF